VVRDSDDKREAPYCNLICPFNGDGPVEGARWLQRTSDRIEHMEKDMLKVERMQEDIQKINNKLTWYGGGLAALNAVVILITFLLKVSEWVQK
jgi:hypothetical protein